MKPVRIECCMRCSALVLLLLCGCFPAAIRPIPVLAIGTGEEPLVFLPGRYSRASDFVTEGFQGSAEEHGFPVVFVDAHMSYYRKRVVVDALQEVIEKENIVPCKMGGISLGGFGATMYARRFPQQVRGLVLFSPFLGDKAFLQRVQTGDVVNDSDSELGHELFACWSFLKETHVPVKIYCGTDDDFAPLIRLLAKQAPRIQVHWMEGGHDWSTWQKMWRDYLSQDVR